MEKHVSDLYKEAYSDISKKWDAYMESHKPKLDKAYDDLQEALKSGDKAAIADAKEVYERTAKNITVNDKRFKDMSEEVAEKISHVNEVAVDYVNDNMAKVYTTNYNAFGDEHISGYSFSLVNENAVKNLATKDKAFLPAKKISIPKDMAWNQKMINSQMFQGILQGENITKLAGRLMNVTDMNKTSSIRNARTMTTAAENKGRQDSFKKASSDGVIMKRVWVATNDERTREAHVELDGQEVDIDEPWENEYGEISYPGDPSADPCNVYNCRCSIRAIVKGFKENEQEVEEEIVLEPEVEEEVIPEKEIVPEVEYQRYTGDDEKMVNEMYKDQINSYKRDEIKAIERYVGSTDSTAYEYEKINGYLRSGGKISKANQSAIDSLDDVISRFEVKEPFTARRGLNLDAFDELLSGINEDTPIEDMKEALIGAEFTDRGYMSSSWNTWGGFFRDAYLEIDVPQGSGYGLMVGNIGGKKGEQEFLIARDTKIEIYDVHLDNKNRLIISSRIIERR